MMRFEFKIEGPVVGVALTSVQGNEMAHVRTRGFYTSDDGPMLYTYLDSIYDAILGHGVPLRREEIRSAFVHIANETDVTALVNSSLVASIVAKGAIEAGAPVFVEQIADISEVRIPDFEFPSTGAIVYLFQHGWRHGLYFDFTAHQPDAKKDKPLGDLAALFGSLHTALLHRERIRMEASVLQRMAADGWFPFARLSSPHVTALYHCYENQWDPAEEVTKILGELTPRITEIVENWASRPAFLPHIDVLRNAARLFSIGENAAAASMLLPKVEGVLRHIYMGPSDRPNAPALRSEFVGRIRANVEGYTALLPEAFIQFLETYYYASFNLSKGKLPPSRNAFLHGVGPDSQLSDPTYALRLFLTLDQIFFSLSRMKEVP